MATDARLKRRWLYVPFVVAAFVIGGYALLWRAGAGEMKKAIALWAEDQRAAGLDVSYSDLKADGFPFFLRVHVEKPEIIAPGQLHWRTDRLTLDTLPYDLTRLIFSVRSEQQLGLAEYGDWRINAETFRFSIANDKARDWAFSMNVDGATALRGTGPASASLNRLVFDLAPSPADKTTLVLSLAADGFAVEDAERSARLDSVETLMAATQMQALSHASLWRQAGGELKINGLNARLDEAKLSVNGALSLDASHHPVGALNTEITAPGPFAEALAQLGIMSEQEAQSAAAALSLVAIAGGGKITAPIEFSNGAAHLSGVKIMELKD